MSRLKTYVLSPTRVSYLRRAAAICGMGLAMLTMSSQVLASVAPITVSGNKLSFGGQVGSVSGVSMFWSNTGWGGDKFYTAPTVNWLKSDWNAKLVRAAMGVNDAGGYLTDASNKTRATTVIDAAIANDMYAIIDFHSHVAHQYQAESIAFFKEMATKYGSGNNIIYEVYNEPLAVSWTGVIKPYAIEVIKAIRAIDPDNLIIVGTPNWSQDVDVAANDPITGYANIAYTLHFYAGTHKQSLRDKAQVALNKGLPLFVTEWGSTDASGDGAVNVSETNAWVSFMKANNISNANWALNDKAEGSAALVTGASVNGGWVSSQLTASGALTKSIVSAWPPIVGGGGSSVAASSQVNTSTPKSSTAASTGNLPSITIQAESYNNMSGIQTETTQDTGGGSNVGWTDAGDWLSYPVVNLPCSGTYTVEYRVASGNAGGRIQLEKSGGTPVYGSITVSGTGGWQNWTTISHDVTLPAGDQNLSISVPQGGWNLNWFRLTPKCGVAASSTAASSIAPASSIPASSKASIAASSSSVASSMNNGGGVLFSETFENGTVNTQPSGWDNFIGWVYNNGNTSTGAQYALIDSTKAYNGGKSIHFKGGAAPAQIIRALPAGTQRLYTRAYVNMSKPMGGVPGDNHEHIFGLKRTPDANDEIRVGQIKGVLGTNHIPSDNIAPKQDQWGKGFQMAANTWYCVETAYLADQAYDTLYMWVNGNLVHTIDSSDDWNNGALGADWMSDKFKYVMFGFHSFSGNSADVWMDDLVVSTQPIGCGAINTSSSARSSVAPSSVPQSSVAPSSVPRSSVAPSSIALSSSSVRSSVAPSSVPVLSSRSSNSSTAVGLGNWELSSTESYLNFVTTKNTHTVEVQKFDAISGSMTNAGVATLTIDLASVNTGIAIRDQRLRDLFFETGLFPTATATTTLDTSVLSSIMVGKSAVVDITVALDLHGVTGLMNTKVLVQKLSNSRVMVQSVAPIIIRSSDYALVAGVEALRAAVGIASVSGTAPVDFVLVFNAK